MDNEIATLESLIAELERAKLPTTKAGIGERALKTLVPLTIQLHAELAAVKARLKHVESQS